MIADRAKRRIGFVYNDSTVVAAMIDLKHRRVAAVSELALEPGIVVGGRPCRPDLLRSALIRSGDQLGSTRTVGGPPTICRPIVKSPRPAEVITLTSDSGGWAHGRPTGRSVDVVVAHLAVLATAPAERADYMARVGWFDIAIQVFGSGERSRARSKVRPRDTYHPTFELRRGNSETDPGVIVEPLGFARGCRSSSRLATLAAGAALIPSLQPIRA